MICKKCGKVLDDEDAVCPRCGTSRQFKGVLPQLIEDFGGLDLFSEENQSRLNRALMQIDESNAKERDLLLIANIKKIPQRLYAMVESSESEKQKVVRDCLNDLLFLDIAKLTCTEVISNLTLVIYGKRYYA